MRCPKKTKKGKRCTKETWSDKTTCYIHHSYRPSSLRCKEVGCQKVPLKYGIYCGRHFRSRKYIVDILQNIPLKNNPNRLPRELVNIIYNFCNNSCCFCGYKICYYDDDVSPLKGITTPSYCFGSRNSDLDFDHFHLLRKYDLFTPTFVKYYSCKTCHHLNWYLKKFTIAIEEEMYFKIEGMEDDVQGQLRRISRLPCLTYNFLYLFNDGGDDNFDDKKSLWNKKISSLLDVFEDDELEKMLLLSRSECQI